MFNIIAHTYLLNENFTYYETEINNNPIYIYSKIIEFGDIYSEMIISFKNKTEIDIIIKCHSIKSINNYKYIIYSYKTLLIQNNIIIDKFSFDYNIFSDYENTNPYELFINDINEHQLIIDQFGEYFYQNIFNKIIYKNRIKRHLDNDDYIDESFESKRRCIYE